MSNNIIYLPIIKTGDAEIRGVENLTNNVKDAITPLFELTRSRKSKNKKDGDIFRRLFRLKEAYGNRQFILDLTGEPNLSNKQIEDLHNNRDGYKNWIEFLVAIQKDFPEIIPTIQISDEGVSNEKEFYERIRKQVESLDKYYDNIVYRFPLEYGDFKKDVSVICNTISSEKIICVIDAGFITQEKSRIYSARAIDVIKELGEFALGKITLAATSFPRNPTEFGGNEKGELGLEEYFFYKGVKEKVGSSIVYGDYATINPTRSLQAGGRGWIPRIDIPTKDTIFYYRSRRSELEVSYAAAYTRVAKLARKDKRYKNVKDEIGDCWGIEQIELASQGNPQGLSPSFWISVRMNIHMTLRKNLL